MAFAIAVWLCAPRRLGDLVVVTDAVGMDGHALATAAAIHNTFGIVLRGVRRDHRQLAVQATERGECLPLLYRVYTALLRTRRGPAQ